MQSSSTVSSSAVFAAPFSLLSLGGSTRFTLGCHTTRAMDARLRMSSTMGSRGSLTATHCCSSGQSNN
uniref:Putative secreted protein n=1 Tax=Ixodes ricinus TaxID=34613 RepID=A0A6B0TQY2_IXORI